MKTQSFASRASTLPGLRALAGETLAGQLSRLARGRLVLVVPPARRPFESYGRMHFHQGFELVVQCLGASQWDGPEDSVGLRRGELMLIPRGVPHQERLADRSACNCNVNFYISQDLVTCHTMTWSAPDSRQVSASAALRLAGQALLFDMLGETVAACGRGGAASDLARGLLTASLSLLAEALAAPERPARPGSRLVELCRQEVLRYLCSTALNVAWLAERLGCSADHLSHVFRKETGRRLNGFISEERIKLGCYLLQSSTLSIAEVALSCGYADPDYFARVFRKATGRAPRDHRRSPLAAEESPGAGDAGRAAAGRAGAER